MAKPEKKRDQVTFTLRLPEEKIQALNFYLNEKGSSLERELEQVCMHLYERKVPANVRRFLNSLHQNSATEPSVEEVDLELPQAENAVVYDPTASQNNTGSESSSLDQRWSSQHTL